MHKLQNIQKELNIMSRKKDVFEKLDYTDQRFNELDDKIFKGGMETVEVQFLGAVAADILASSREVFDYCAKDIVDVYILPNEKTIAQKVASGQLRIYYPFYKKQLTKKDQIFKKLKEHNKPLHSHLFSIAASIEANKTRPKTRLRYGILKEMSDMVNQKKHDSLLAIQSSENETIYSQTTGARMMIRKDEQVGVSYIRLPKGAKHAIGNSYVFESNKRDLMMFTMNCRVLTRLIMNDIYKTYLP